MFWNLAIRLLPCQIELEAAMATQVSIQSDAARRRSALESKLRELSGGTHERDELRIEYLADPVDQVRSSAEREMVVHRLDQRARLMHEIRAALEKIEDGSYGICEQCEEPIARKRLDAVPWARLCVRCQSEAEAAASEERPTFEEAA
jgi:DnaK suppressor protein